MHPAIVSRIKIMSNLKIDEQRIPQDGRTQVTTKDNREMDLRVSSFPTVNGEKNSDENTGQVAENSDIG